MLWCKRTFNGTVYRQAHKATFCGWRSSYPNKVHNKGRIGLETFRLPADLRKELEEAAGRCEVTRSRSLFKFLAKYE